jgi:signal transduction histidine kinase
MSRSYEDTAGQVVVAVKDSRVGILDEHAGHVFNAFFSTTPGGLGIGLSICRPIIEDHDGRRSTTDDDDGPGATFRFALPAHRASARQTGQKIRFRVVRKAEEALSS